jgi:ferredoxin-NADP reductase/Na+-translocating ferredoxin:NAD+ oxidoreductase RnfD subunit
MMGIIDRVLNRVTMYRLVLYYLVLLVVAALGLGFLGLVPAKPVALASSLAVVTGVCWLTNRAFGLLLRVPLNAESVYITALILVLIMPPVTPANQVGTAGLMLAALVAIASKFALVVGRRHIFNPVAIGAVVSGLVLNQPAIWWVGGNSSLLPLVLVAGLLVARKVQRFDMVGVYVLSNLAALLATTPPVMYGLALHDTLMSSPLFFAGFAMLTDPLTSANGRWSRLVYGAIVGALSSPNVSVGGLYLTPELAFLIGNLYAFAVDPRGRVKLALLRVEKTAAGCYDYVFRPDRRIDFRPGQYLDWTLDLPTADSRGNRRPFTIASAPSEREIRLGVKFYPEPSAFKRRLLRMRPGDVIYGSRVAGSFTLPSDTREKLVFIAGGIGITPFRSMVQDLRDRGEARPIILLYGGKDWSEVAYQDVFTSAEEELGLRAIYVLAADSSRGSHARSGLIDKDLIQREVPDMAERTFYISGPRAMVVAFERSLRALGISRSRIKVDYFPGFA